MDVRVVTLRYQESVQGFVEEAVTRATAGREVVEVREHFFVYGNVPHPRPANRSARKRGSMES